MLLLSIPTNGGHMITVLIGKYIYKYKGGHSGGIFNTENDNYILLNTENTKLCNKSDKHIELMIFTYKQHLDK